MGDKTYETRPELSEEDRKNLNNYSDVVAKLLFYRDIKTNEAAHDFINLDYNTGVHDPFLLKGMDKTVDRILTAIKENQKICIFSDYDADGVPGAVVLSDFFKKIDYENFFVYIPHRNLEGFGLNNKAIEKIAEDGTSLIITIDCGITDVEQVDLANSLKMDVIITDHHEEGQKTPKAYSIVDHKQKGCEYPEEVLCGSGIIFKVVQGLIAKGDFGLPEGCEKWLLDMVGVATLSDMVPLTGENRIFAAYGLIVLQKTKRKGLLKLLSNNGMNPKYLTEEDVVFTVTPRINAASRMGHPEAAFKMLSATDDVEAAETVKYLHKINDERKSAVAVMVKEIKKYIEDELVEDGKIDVPIIVKGNPKWQPSLLGLAASSIVDTYHRPAFVWGRGEGDELKGSCRSDGSASVVDVMTALKDGILKQFGGHKMAGGFVLNFDAVDVFEEEMIDAYNSLSSEGIDHSTVIVDDVLKIDEVNWKLFDEIKKLAPFGVGNHRPVFLFNDVAVTKVDFFGKTKDHLRLFFNKSDGSEFSAIQFFAKDNPKVEKIKDGDKISFTASIEKSVFGGRVELRLKLVDIV